MRADEVFAGFIKLLEWRHEEVERDHSRIARLVKFIAVLVVILVAALIAVIALFRPIHISSHTSYGSSHTYIG
jgi:hypothetical protein